MDDVRTRIDWLKHWGCLDQKSLFMDLNYWIDLTKPGKENEELKKLLFCLVHRGKLICPVSPSLLIECEKQGNIETRNKVYAIMDELSSGLSLRMMQDTFYDEFDAVMKGQPNELEFAYSYYAQSLMPIIALPEGHPTPISHFMNDLFVGDPAWEIQQKLSERTQLEWTWRRQTKPSSEFIEQEEFVGTANALLPQIQKVMQELGMNFSNDLTSQLKESLDRCPSFLCSHKTMSTLRISGEALYENDVFDFLNTAFAVPYVDCLACDKRSRDVLMQRLKLHDKYATNIVSGKDDLAEWLKGLKE